MADDNFDMFIQRYEMGQAYIAITEEMGPSAQLLAFMEYDKVISTDPDVNALESLTDLAPQHEQMLLTIAEDPALELAMESFVGRTKSILEKIKKAITNNKHSEDLEAFLKSSLTERKSNIYVESHADFNNALAAHQKVLPVLTWILSRLPKSGELKVWEDFAKKYVHLGRTSEFDAKIKEIAKLNTQFKGYWDVASKDFKESDWSPANFKSSISAYLVEIKKSESDYELAYEITDDLYKLISDTEELNIASSSESHETDGSKDDNGNRKVTSKQTINYSKREDVVNALKAMRKAETALDDVTGLIFRAEHMMARTLNHVANHYNK